FLQKFPHFSTEDRRIYAAMVASLDESVGNITKALKRSGLYDNSVIVFTTDNGGAPWGFNWNQGSNYPLRGGKVTLWEGGVRGVGFVHSNLIRKKERVSYDLIDATDWLPTFYHLAGGNVSMIEDKIDGMNVWDTLAHGKKSPRTEVLHNIDPISRFAAIRVERYKLVVNQDGFYKSTWYPRYEVPGELDTMPQPRTLPGAVIQCGEWNSSIETACNSDVFPCLFDIEEDPCEYKNIAKTHIDIVRRLVLRLIYYQRRALPVWFPETDTKADPAKHCGFWSPWRSSKKNKAILQKVIDNLPSGVERKHKCKGKCAARETKKTEKTEKVSFNTYEAEEKKFYQTLKGILRMVNEERKKGHIPRASSKVTKASNAMLW
ncbi:arylsulfatase I-like, partial [Orbicella faveolata]|uniref:arylsulfatase I-like n=1 Tax=Orbicella faveolata TaxID=48498 RepID=UPI0009E1F933